MAQLFTPLNVHSTKLFMLALVVAVRLASKPGETITAIATILP